MIPTDLAARLRLLAEASFFDSEPPVQGTARVREIQARLPQLLPGQQFTAQITRALPDNTFQALVAGREYTLALNHPAKAGDALELVVTRNTANAVFARVVGEGSGTQNPANVGAQVASRPQLSPTGRLISFLLTGQPTPQPTALAAGRPLLSAPPAHGGADLAPLLRQALSQSGLFYEAHQAKWLAGRTGTDALRAEPQGQQPALARNETASAPRVAPSTATSFIGRGGEALAERAADAAQAAAQSRGPVVAERLMPVVHQQLDAMATQQYLLHGQAWPGQRFEWELEDPWREGGEEHASDGQDGWDSTLRLTMPRLGSLEARLHLTAAGVAIRLVSDDAATAAALEAAHDRLDAALSAADVPLTGFVAEVRDGE
ncbi:flagellar hook-length control protein FliK [Pseudazoarcus pumilus]|uniref:Flagellar hook-length control protein FliK n=1 Tax=Pseudazoarcus pumilus TaxID=2067960 RepID=A0A2I6S8G1_9RHOO|nr:flagellar hook-length control protein FliK [Pseudazoarcus pumilus]AUN95527.1 flagellar hook-length control protein FliK [Pseudazoarcus pumilus]